MKSRIPYIVVILLITACKQRETNVDKNDSSVTKTIIQPINKKDSVVKKSYPLTDSGQLMLHLDSLPRYHFGSEPGTPSLTDTVSLSIFKNKKLFNIPLKLIPTVIGDGFIDHAEDLDNDNKLPDSVKVTFNLADTAAYKITATIVAITPKFVALDLQGIC